VSQAKPGEKGGYEVNVHGCILLAFTLLVFFLPLLLNHGTLFAGLRKKLK